MISNKNNRITVYLYDDEYNKLKELSKITGAPRTDIVRRAIKEYYRNNLQALSEANNMYSDR